MSWYDEVYKISVVKHANGEFPFEVELWNRDGKRVYSQLLQKTGDAAWKLANQLKAQVPRTGVLEMFIVDENLEDRVMQIALSENS